MDAFIINNTALYLCLRRKPAYSGLSKLWADGCYTFEGKYSDERFDRLNAYLDGLSTSKRDATAYTTTVFYKTPVTTKRDAKGRFASNQQPTKEGAR